MSTSDAPGTSDHITALPTVVAVEELDQSDSATQKQTHKEPPVVQTTRRPNSSPAERFVRLGEAELPPSRSYRWQLPQLRHTPPVPHRSRSNSSGNGNNRRSKSPNEHLDKGNKGEARNRSQTAGVRLSPPKPQLESQREILDAYRAMQSRDFASQHEELQHLRISHVQLRRIVRLRCEEVARLRKEAMERAQEISRLEAIMENFKKRCPSMNGEVTCSVCGEESPCLLHHSAKGKENVREHDGFGRGAPARMLLELRQNLASRDTVIDGLRTELAALKQTSHDAEAKSDTVRSKEKDDTAAQKWEKEVWQRRCGAAEATIAELRQRLHSIESANPLPSTSSLREVPRDETQPTHVIPTQNVLSGEDSTVHAPTHEMKLLLPSSFVGVTPPKEEAPGVKCDKGQQTSPPELSTPAPEQEQQRKVKAESVQERVSQKTPNSEQMNHNEEHDPREPQSHLGKASPEPREDHPPCETPQPTEPRLRYTEQGADASLREALREARSALARERQAAAEAARRWRLELSQRQSESGAASYLEAQLSAARRENDTLSERLRGLREEVAASGVRERTLREEFARLRQTADAREEETCALRQRVSQLREDAAAAALDARFAAHVSALQSALPQLQAEMAASAAASQQLRAKLDDDVSREKGLLVELEELRRGLRERDAELQMTQRRLVEYETLVQGFGERKVSSLRAARTEAAHWRKIAEEREAALASSEAQRNVDDAAIAEALRHELRHVDEEMETLRLDRDHWKTAAAEARRE